MNQYRSYRPVDFALDEYFQQWILQADPEAANSWRHWLTEHPERQAEIDEARQILLTLGQAEVFTDDERRTRLKRAILTQITSDQASTGPQRKVPWRWMAACLLILFLAGGGSFWGYQRWAYVSYTTHYGENQSFTLPDSSEVTLKANSHLRHARHWQADQDREVWLEGEAFFHVTEQKVLREESEYNPKQRFTSFTVHATELVDVAVLGTEFNVSTRNTETEVVLKSGSVRIDVKHKMQPQTVLMKPGDLVEVEHRQGTLTQQRIDPRSWRGWSSNLLIFNEVTLATVAKKLHHTYGVTVIFQNPALGQRKFKGFVPTNNLDMILEAFKEMYDLRIEQKGNQLIFLEQSD